VSDVLDANGKMDEPAARSMASRTAAWKFVADGLIAA